jgi:hypothetical protein
MLRKEYNRLYDVWLVAKPEYTDTSDWTKIWDMFARNTYIQETIKIKETVKTKASSIDLDGNGVPW